MTDDRTPDPEPLCDESAEKALLGCVLLHDDDRDILALVSDIVAAQDFYSEPHAEIWRAMLTVRSEGSDIDAVTVCHELKERGSLDRCGGPAYFDQLIDAAPVVGHPEEYAKLVAHLSWRRKMRHQTGRLHTITKEPGASREDIEAAIRKVQHVSEDSVDELPSCTAEELDDRKWPVSDKWLIHDLWLASGVGIIGGDPKSAKSIIAQCMCLSIVSGEPFLRRWPVSVTGPCVYIAEEDAEKLTQPRIRKLAKNLGINHRTRDLVIACQKGARLDTAHGRGRIASLVRRVKPVFTVLDCWKRLAPKINENLSSEVTPVLGWLRELQIETGTAIAVVHHITKGRDWGPSPNILQQIRGTGDFAAWLDSAIGMEWPNRKKSDHYMTATHRGAGDMDETNVRIRWDDERDEVFIDIGEPRNKKSRQRGLADDDAWS